MGISFLLLGLSTYRYIKYIYDDWQYFIDPDQSGPNGGFFGIIIPCIILTSIIVFIFVLCLKKRFEAAIIPVTLLVFRGVIIELTGFPFTVTETSSNSWVRDRILINIALCAIPICVFTLIILYKKLLIHRKLLATVIISLMLIKPILLGFLRNITYNYNRMYNAFEKFSDFIFSIFIQIFVVGDAINYIILARRNPDAFYVFDYYLLSLIIFTQYMLLILLLIRGINEKGISNSDYASVS